ncbi:MAG: rhomboid family intramembrane serine protease [Elusimicrobia bacterium]|nr:rhomboid family intramembrane serine protease [Elusimicrobiota bacterium]
MSRRFEHGPLDFKSMSPVIKALVVINAAVFIISLLVGGQFKSLFGLVPYQVVHERWIWQPFTYLFLHGTFFHVLFNLFALWMFGMPVEAQWGPREFLKYFLITGVGAGLVSVAVAPDSHNVIIGASGAVFGLLVAFAMLYPDAVVYLYFFFPIKAKHMAMLFGAIEFFAGASAANPASARVAHLSGMAIGYFYIRWWWVLTLRLKTMFSSPGGTAERGAAPKTRRRPLPVGAPRPDAPAAAPSDDMTEVDRILDKIIAQGESSLTDKEREVLRRQSRKKGGEGSA